MSVLLEKVTATFANRPSDLAERHRTYVVLIVECVRFAKQAGNQVATFQEVVQALGQTARAAEQRNDTKFASLVRKQLLRMEDCLRVRLAQERAAEKTSTSNGALQQDLPYRGIMDCLDELHGMTVTLWKSFRPMEGDDLSRSSADATRVPSNGVPPAPLMPQKTAVLSNAALPPIPVVTSAVAAASGKPDNAFLPQGAVLPERQGAPPPPGSLSSSPPAQVGSSGGTNDANSNMLSQILNVLDSPVASTTRANVSVQRLTSFYETILAKQPEIAKQILPYITACKDAINDSTRPLAKREELVKECTLRIIKIVEAAEKRMAPVVNPTTSARPPSVGNPTQAIRSANPVNTVPATRPADPVNAVSSTARSVNAPPSVQSDTTMVQKRLVEAESRDLEILKKQLDEVRALHRTAEQRAVKSEQRLQETLQDFQDNLEKARKAETAFNAQLQALKEESAQEKEKSDKAGREVERLSEQNSLLKTRYLDATTEFEARIESLQTEREGLQNQLQNERLQNERMQSAQQEQLRAREAENARRAGEEAERKQKGGGFTLAEQTERVRAVNTALPEEMRIRTRKLIEIAEKLLAKQSAGGQDVATPADNSDNANSGQTLFQAEELTGYVYGTLPSAGVMAAFGSAASMLYAEVAALQYQLHLALMQSGWELIFPRAGERADSRRHQWSEVDLEIIYDDPSRDGAIASVIRPGIAHNGVVLQRAEVRRYTYLPPASDNDLFDR